MDFVVPEDHRMKIKESEKIDKDLDLARGQKTMEHESDGDNNYGCALVTIPKGLVYGREDLEIIRQVETIQITALRSRIPRRVLETSGDLLSHKPQWETIS